MSKESEAERLGKEADTIFDNRKFDAAAEAYKKSVEAAEAEKHDKQLVRALVMVARCYLIQGKGEIGRPYLERAGKLASPEEPENWSRYLGTRGRYEWKDEKNNPKACITFIQWYDFCVAHKLYKHAIDAAHMVAIVGSPDEQIEWALKGIAAAEKSGEEGWLGPLWNNLGWSYDERGEHEKALDALQKAREYHCKGDDDIAKLVADFGVGHALRKVGRLKEAREWLVKAFDWAQRRYNADPAHAHNNEWMGWGHKYVGELMVDEGKRAEGLAEMKKGRPYLIKSGIEKWGAGELEKFDARVAELEGIK